MKYERTVIDPEEIRRVLRERLQQKAMEAEMEDMMIAPPVDSGLMAAAKEVAVTAAISSW